MNVEEIIKKYGKEILEKQLGRKRVAKVLQCTPGQARHVLEVLKKMGVSKVPESQETIPEKLQVSPVQQTEQMDAFCSLETPYIYDTTKDVYFTFLKGRTLQVAGVTHRSMKADYSNWDQKPATLNQICIRYQIPRNYLVQYVKIHGWTHDSEPFSDEVVLEKPVDALVEDALMRKKHHLATAYEKARWSEVEKDAKRWREFEYTVLGELRKSISKEPPAVPRLVLPKKQDFALVMAPQDFHWGGYAWEDETGEHYNRKEAEARILSKTEEIVSLLPGTPEKIYLSVGGDWFHVDGDHTTTTKGTPMEPDGSPGEIFITGCEMALRHIEVLRQVAPVELVFMGGNHDRANSLALLMYLGAWYRNTKDVSVHHTPALRTYLEYKQVLMGFTHGDKVKPKDLGHVMAHEAMEAWGRTKSHIWFTGHLHHEVVREIGGVVQYQLPSLAGTDRWHARQGYTTARSGLCGHLVGQQGVFMSLFAKVGK